VTYLPVEKNGLVNLETFASAITPKTLMASFMLVNNEIGILERLIIRGSLRFKRNRINLQKKQGFSSYRCCSSFW
jgi:hypothetical protein